MEGRIAMMISNKNLLALCIFLVSSHIAIASDDSEESVTTDTKQPQFSLSQSELEDDIPNVYSLSMWVGWPINNQKNQTIYLEPDLVKTYTAAQSAQALAQGEIFAGWQKVLPHELTGEIGIAYGASATERLSGNIWEDADPTFNNFNYDYQLNHQRVMVEGMLMAPAFWKNVSPYIKVGIGAAFNQLGSYSITPLIDEEVAAPPFYSNTTTAFSYMVGAGLHAPIKKNWQIGIGYAFSDWGKSQLKPAAGETLNNTPSLPNFYLNSVVVQLSYIR